MSDLVDQLVAEVLARPRREVERLDCPGCQRCWACADLPRSVAIQATGRYVDITHGSARATTVVEHGRPIADAELARPWLRLLVSAQRPQSRRRRPWRVPWEHRALAHLDKRPPRWWSGDSRPQPLVYIDVRRAYPSIYRWATLDCHWRPDDERPSLGFGAVEFLGVDELPKQVHRTVGGIIRATEMTVIDRGTPVVHSTLGWSPYLAPDLWGLLMDTLHLVAETAVRHGAIMWDTDGGIAPADLAGRVAAAIERRVGLEVAVRAEGEGRVWGVKHWQIGDVATRQRGRRRVLPVEHGVQLLPRAAARLIEKAMGR